MNIFYGVVHGLLATGVTYVTAWCYPQWLHAGSTMNYRGRRVSLAPGFALAAGYAVVLLMYGEGVFFSDHVLRENAIESLWLFASIGAVFAAGVYDDRGAARVHGLRAHFAELVKGHVSSGIVKLLVVVAAVTVAALALGARGWTLVVGVPLLAGVTNLWNLLDVAPGRALKFGLVAAVSLLPAGSWWLVWATIGSAAVLLPLDVRERGMLGDAGANVLGFVLGILLLVQLPLAGMVVALAVVLALHGLAETVTLTRIIRAVPPLRWMDDLWRLPAADPTMN
jgi:hypothetical protein